MAINAVDKHSENEKLQAAYALNMCTVSVSQIVDYNDIYVLEQEYDAILNNLNLEKMPKDEALLNILTEVLNVITFFRIEEIKKEQIEKRYQENVRNAIWSAVPNMTMMVAGDPLTIAFSLATQVGIGYMNYRKAKANAASEKENEEVELEITALEQFNALRRELFTTAWRLADEYKFPDKYRLTERQIKQYNEILMDPDDMRKYERLEAVADKFEAYPPFWYYLGHTANSIVFDDSNDDSIKAFYKEKAKVHFDKFYEMCRFNLLREDQMIASYALEYVDLLLLDEDWNTPEKIEKICSLISLAVEMAGNANDTLELCAVSYMKIGKSSEAANLYRYLVNEDYNKLMNARILSRIYVSEYTKGIDSAARVNYNILKKRVPEKYLFPMPKESTSLTGDAQDKDLERVYIKNQKDILTRQYFSFMDKFREKYQAIFDEILPNEEQWRADPFDCIETLRTGRFRYKGLSVLNQVVNSLDALDLFAGDPHREDYIKTVRDNIIDSNDDIKILLDKLNEDPSGNIDSGEFFDETNLKELRELFSFNAYMGEFFDDVKDGLITSIKDLNSSKRLDDADFNLSQLAEQEEILLPPVITVNENDIKDSESETSAKKEVFEGRLLNIDSEKEKKIEDLKKQMVEIVTNKRNDIIKSPEKICIYVKGEDKFNSYFENESLNVSNIKQTKSGLKEDTVAIIDNLAWALQDSDLILTYDGVRGVVSNKVQKFCRYDELGYKTERGQAQITLPQSPYNFANKAVDIENLDAMLKELAQKYFVIADDIDDVDFKKEEEDTPKDSRHKSSISLPFIGGKKQADSEDEESFIGTEDETIDTVDIEETLSDMAGSLAIDEQIKGAALKKTFKVKLPKDLIGDTLSNVKKQITKDENSENTQKTTDGKKLGESGEIKDSFSEGSSEDNSD